MPAAAHRPAPASGGDALLRPVLELAFDVAAIGARSTPAIDAPRAMRPFLHFGKKRPDNALAAARRALDEDEGFRARVAGLADEVELGRAGWLLVERPEGWAEELASLTAAADAAARAAYDEQEERSARRRLASAEKATQRATEAAARARAELAAAHAELATERRARRAAHDEAAQLTRRVESLEGERDSARRKAAASAAEAERAQADAAGLQAELAAARAALGALAAEAEAEALRAEAARLRTEAGGGPAGPGARPSGPVDGRPPAAAPRCVAEGAGADVAAVARAVAAAAAAAAALGQALGEASAALAPSLGLDEGSDGPAAAGPPAEAVTARPRPPRRRPAVLPPAVFDDTTEAAAHLVRGSGALVLVDGYNAAKALWPDVPPLELRERLVDALSELVVRTGASIHVVYDGDDVAVPQSRPVGRRGVRVSFSPPDVEADDVILDLIGTIPLDQPVVVASSDRRVQVGARQRGANVISSAQLAAIMGRS